MPNFDSRACINWFHKEFVPAVYAHQTQFLQRKKEQVKAGLIWNGNYPHSLVSQCGRIRAFKISIESSALIEPLNFEVLPAFKRIYRYHFILWMTNYEAGEQSREWKIKCAERLKGYTLTLGLEYLSQAWYEVPKTLLGLSWNILVDNHDEAHDIGFAGVPKHFFEEHLALAPMHVHSWLNCEVMYKAHDDEQNIHVEVEPPREVSNQEAISAVNTILDYLAQNQSLENSYGRVVYNLRELLQQHDEKQKISNTK